MQSAKQVTKQQKTPTKVIEAPTANKIMYVVLSVSNQEYQCSSYSELLVVSSSGLVTSSTGTSTSLTIGSGSGGGVGSQVGSSVTNPSYSMVTPVSSDQMPVHGFSSVNKCYLETSSFFFSPIVVRLDELATCISS
jgi:hypothetical protein